LENVAETLTHLAANEQQFLLDRSAILVHGRAEKQEGERTGIHKDPLRP